MKKDAALKEQAEADAAGMKTVGADRKDTKSSSAASESIEKNLESQSSSKPAGSGRAAGIMGCFQSNSYGGNSFVDATTACNDVNDMLTTICVLLFPNRLVFMMFVKKTVVSKNVSVLLDIFQRFVPIMITMTMLSLIVVLLQL